MQLIFDFDGTLADTLDRVLAYIHCLSRELNLPKMSAVDIEQLRDMSSKKIIKKLNIPFYKLPQLIRKTRQHLFSATLDSPVIENIIQTLKNLHDLKFSLGILTSNSKENVSAWLEKNDIRHLFEFIYSTKGFFDKGRILKKIIKNHRLDKRLVYYIGDETRDIDAAKKSNIASVAVTWGFNSEKILLAHQPQYIARKPEDLLEIFRSDLSDND